MLNYLRMIVLEINNKVILIIKTLTSTSILIVYNINAKLLFNISFMNLCLKKISFIHFKIHLV